MKAIEQIIRVAELAHGINREWCMFLGDNSQPLWNDAPNWQKESMISGVMNAINNPDDTPKDTHEKWLEHKSAEGWAYGEVKDVDKKTHPCMVPYEMLPPPQRRKDTLFLFAVHTAIDQIGDEEDWR